MNKIRPLPQRIENNGKWQVENEGIEHENATKKVNSLDRFEIKLDTAKQETTKQIIWERKLLDFSLRNNLINVKLGKRVIPFISFEIDHLEDRLQAGENYQIQPCPIKGKLEPRDTDMYDSSLLKNELEELVISELKNKRIRSYLTESELQNALKFVYRTSRTAIEENGANSLFLVLGILKWYETPKSIKPRFAPILLLPIDIIRRGGTNGYVIRTRDEEIILNITLVELLKQQFDINLSGLNPLPKDDISLESNQKLENSISRLMELLPIISTGRTFFSDNWDFVIPDSWEGIELMAQMSSRLVAIPYLNKGLLELGGKEELIGEWQEIINSGQERDRILAELSKDYAPEILDENVFTLQQEWKAIEMKWFLPKYFAKRSYLKKLRFYSPSLQETKIPNLLDQLGTYQKQNKIVQEHSSELQSLFGHLGRRNKEKWDEITSILSAIPGVYQNLLEYARLTQRSLPETLNRFSDKMGDDWNLYSPTKIY